MKSFLRLLAYAKPYRRFWPGYLVLSIFSVIFGVVNYALIDPLLTVLFQSDTIESEAVMPQFAMSAGYFQDLFQYYLVQVKNYSGTLYALLFVCIIIILASLISNLTRYWLI